MGILDSVKDLFDGDDGKEQAGLLNAAQGLLSGGLKDVREKFEASGLGDTFKSWVGSGENQQVTKEDMKKAFGEDKLKEMAEREGMEPDTFMEKLTGFFPKLIDQVTPDGKEGADRDIMASVKGILNKIPGL